MTTKVIPLTTVSVQQVKPDLRFGQPSYMSLFNAARALLRASLTGIPTGATVQSAAVTLRTRNKPTWAGSRTIYIRALTAPFSTASTWNNQPANSATNQGSLTITSAPFGTYWNIDVTAIVQSMVSGTITNNGFVAFTTDASVGQIQGSTAPWGQPQLTVDYVTTAVSPTALHPSSGAVSKAKPTLTFQAASDTSSIQVQVDASANSVSPAFDSGEVSATAGLLDLSATSYAGLADGTSTQWRARAKNALGWSGWSSWVTFNRVAWGTLAITSPPTTSEDPSPVITAAYSGGTVTSWRALLKDSLGAVLQDSGWTPGSAIAYATTKSVGSSGTAVVRVRDDTVRDATPGDPDYTEAALTFTVAPSGTPAAFTDLTTYQDGVSPFVMLEANRSQVPDEVAIYRNGVLAERRAGAEVFTGNTFSYYDRTAPMNTTAVYTLYAIVNGAWSNVSNTSTIAPTCIGIWLIDADTGSGDAALILGDDDQDQSQPEVSIVHRPISGPAGAPQVVRRRLSRYPREGVITGTLVDAMDVTAATSEAALRAWVDYDAGHIYRLILGNQNDPVILGDIDFDELAINGLDERVLGVSLNWWVQD